jgi:hypothetical protein
VGYFPGPPPGSERGNVIAGIRSGRRVWLRIGLGRRIRPDLGVFPAVVGGGHERVRGPVTGDGVGQRFDDGRRPAAIGVAQPAGPDETRVMTHIRIDPHLGRSSFMSTVPSPHEHVRALAVAIRHGELTSEQREYLIGVLYSLGTAATLAPKAV